MNRNSIFTEKLHSKTFARKVHIIVVEGLNALYQEDLDRFMRGEDVPLAQVQKVWRDSTGIFVGPVILTIYQQFLSEVRSVNRGLPARLKLRVIAADPPLIRLGTVELTEPYKVRFIELIDDSFYDVFLVNNRSLRGDGNGGNEQGSHRRESGNPCLEHDEYFVIVRVPPIVPTANPIWIRRRPAHTGRKLMFGAIFSSNNREASEVHAAILRTKESCRVGKRELEHLSRSWNCGEDCYAQAARRS
jgi:hypothetical protein